MNSKSLSVAPTQTPNHVARMLHRVLSSYPTANPVVLKGYLAELSRIFSGHAPAVADAGLSAAMRASPNFPPAVPLVEESCATVADSSTWLRSWEINAQRQLEDARKRDQELIEEPVEQRRAAVERIMADYHAKRAPDPERPKKPWQPPTTMELQASLVRLMGVEREPVADEQDPMVL